MKKASLLALMIVSVSAIYSQAQTPATNMLDTIIYYKVDSESMSLNGSEAIYKVNDQIVSQQQWHKMTIGKSQLKTCTPCMVKTYNDRDILISVGMQYKWCQSGVYTGYYPDGKIKVTGQYKTNANGIAGKPTSSAYCGIKEGTWTYYSEAGEVTKTELYKNGVAVK